MGPETGGGISLHLFLPCEPWPGAGLDVSTHCPSPPHNREAVTGPQECVEGHIYQGGPPSSLLTQRCLAGLEMALGKRTGPRESKSLALVTQPGMGFEPRSVALQILL